MTIRRYSEDSSKDRVIWRNYDATGRDLHVDVPMSKSIQEYQTQGLVGEFIFNVVPVPKQSNMIPSFPLGEFCRAEHGFERAPGTDAHRVYFDVGSTSYFCKNYAARYPLTIEDQENADGIWDLRENGGRLCADVLRIRKEIRTFNTVNSTSNVSTAFLPASAWNAGGDPIRNIIAMQNQIQDISGQRPNRVVFGHAAWRATLTNSNVRNLLFPHGGGVPTTAQVGQVLDADVRVAAGYYNTGGLGNTASLTKFFNDRVLVFFGADGTLGPSPRYAATLRWTKAGIPAMAVEALPYDAQKKVNFVEVGVYDDEKVLNTALAATLIGVNSSQANGIVG